MDRAPTRAARRLRRAVHARTEDIARQSTCLQPMGGREALSRRRLKRRGSRRSYQARPGPKRRQRQTRALPKSDSLRGRYATMWLSRIAITIASVCPARELYRGVGALVLARRNYQTDPRTGAERRRPLLRHLLQFLGQALHRLRRSHRAKRCVRYRRVKARTGCHLAIALLPPSDPAPTRFKRTLAPYVAFP